MPYKQGAFILSQQYIVSKSKVVMAGHSNWNVSEKLTNSKLKLETPQE